MKWVTFVILLQNALSWSFVAAPLRENHSVGSTFVVKMNVFALICSAPPLICTIIGYSSSIMSRSTSLISWSAFGSNSSKTTVSCPS